jgi:hypothetical protein
MLDLTNKTPKEKANLKGREIAKIKKLARTKRKGFDIEIVKTKAIEGGVEVFIKAWKDGKQVGFGKDGTVEIERVRLFNPPILVADKSGDVVREWTDEETKEKSKGNIGKTAKKLFCSLWNIRFP